jgi:glycosyltransferase involved in cell wall biosynthesis
MSAPATAPPAICLNMIVRNEAHIIHELLDVVAPFISCWVIVDTGSDDGTQDVIRSHTGRLGIPGELHERPWRDFGHNRSEALTLAQGHGDYIWVMDADDIVTGTLDLGRLNADVYATRVRDGETNCIYWRRQLFRDGMPWRYLGVVHEYPHCDDPYVEKRLEGEYYIESRRLGGRNLDPQKYGRDRDLLLAEVERHPQNARSVFYLAQSYFNLGDYTNARKWSERRARMGGWEEEIYYSKFRAAEAMARCGVPWPEVQDAFLRAWEFRPTRVEPLHAISTRYRTDQQYHLGYLFAERAARIPLPEEDILFVDADIYQWRAADEQAVCASWIGKYEESFTLCRNLLARDDLPDDDRKRIAGNRDITASQMIDAAFRYPETIPKIVAGHRDSEVTVSLLAGPDRIAVEQALNSFLRCCTDVSQVGRFVVQPFGLTAGDRATLLERYQFLEFLDDVPGDVPAARLARVRDEVAGRFWLHIGAGWRFFAPDSLIGRLTAVLETEQEVFQIGINVDDATKLTGACAAETAVRRADGAGRYVLGDVVATGPAMFETARLDRAGGIDGTDRDPFGELGRRANVAGLRTATLDEVLCIAGVTADL